MPTLEIASVNSTGLNLNQDDYKLCLIEETKLESHRGLFYDFLINQNGTIIHIGNPDFKKGKESGFFAGHLFDWDFDSETNFKFKREFKNDLESILRIAINKSPEHKIYLLTDYQFGPKNEDFKSIESLEGFWKEHDSGRLKFNTLYEVKEN